MQRVLVTGADGFTGRYAVKALLASGYEVFSLKADLLNTQSLDAELQELRPNKVLHLAALSFVNEVDEQAFYKVNLFGTQTLLRALSLLNPLPEKIVLASSANVYGISQAILDENVRPKPINHYAISKLAMEHMAGMWFDRLPIIITRPFNYTGVGQDEKFLIPKIVSHFIRKEKYIELGNLEIERDFSDVRMVVNAYKALLECDVESEIVNISSGVVWSLKQIIDLMSQISHHALDVKINPNFIRVNDLKTLKGTTQKLRGIIGNSLENIPLQETLKWMYFASASDTV